MSSLLEASPRAPPGNNDGDEEESDVEVDGIDGDQEEDQDVGQGDVADGRQSKKSDAASWQGMR